MTLIRIDEALVNLRVNDEIVAPCVTVVCGICVEAPSIDRRLQSVILPLKEKKPLDIAYIMLRKHIKARAKKKLAPGPTARAIPPMDHS